MTGDFWPIGSWTCNCACQVCMTGDCCMRPNRLLGTITTWTSTTTGPTHEHDYAKFDAKRLFCRRCGETKDIS